MKEHQYSFDELRAITIPANSFTDLLVATKAFPEIQEAFGKHYNKFATGEYENIAVSVSGGADSDRLIDFIERVGYPQDTVHYTFFDTGMEFQATKEHLLDLEVKYEISIDRIHAKVPVALACRKYGVPFLSKQVSEYIYRLQSHGFKWEDRPFEELYAKYPKCKAALRWWCNEWGESSRLNIYNWKYLKEFMIENPPDFRISPICCQKAKKETAHRAQKELDADLVVQGVRKAEGGARSTAVHSCFSQNDFQADVLRPLFWFKKDDCEKYDDLFGVEHSACYTQYGLRRTGCACCPFGKDFEYELDAAKRYEPKLYKLANLVFGKSYEYMRKYKEFRRKKEKE